MDVNLIPKEDRILLFDPMPQTSCVFCGNQYGTVNFKGKCVCEDCLSFVKDLM